MAKLPRTLALTLGAYAALAFVGELVATLRGSPDLWVTTPWLALSSGARLAASLAAGALVAVATVAATPIVTRRSARVRALHADLRPAVRGLPSGELLVMALASGIGEELFFRGALTPWLGVVVSSALFGLLHQVRGAARWVWVVWAGAMGLTLALIFVATGHLAGPMLAHVAINAVNLRYLRDHEPGPAGDTGSSHSSSSARGVHRLGGLLARR